MNSYVDMGIIRTIKYDLSSMELVIWVSLLANRHNPTSGSIEMKYWA